MRICKPHELQKFFIVSSSAHALKSPRRNMFLYLVVNVSNVLLIISRSFFILFFCGLYEQLISHFFLWRIISTKKLSGVGKSWLRTLAGMSSRIYNNMPAEYAVLLRSNLIGQWKSSIENWLCGKLSSSLVSDIIKMSIEPLICSHRRSNLFVKELIIRCPDINLLTLLMRMFLRVFLASEKVAVKALDTFSFSL